MNEKTKNLIEAIEFLLGDLNSNIDYESQQIVLYHLEQFKKEDVCNTKAN